MVDGIGRSSAETAERIVGKDHSAEFSPLPGLVECFRFDKSGGYVFARGGMFGNIGAVARAEGLAGQFGAARVATGRGEFTWQGVSSS